MDQLTGVRSGRRRPRRVRPHNRVCKTSANPYQ